MYLVSCGYDIESNIYDPWGTQIAEAKERPGVAVVEVDLSEPVPCPYPWPLGNMRHRLLRERRADIKVPALER